MRGMRLEHHPLPLSHASVHSHERAPGIRGSGGEGGFPHPRRNPRRCPAPRSRCGWTRARASHLLSLSSRVRRGGISGNWAGVWCGCGLGGLHRPPHAAPLPVPTYMTARPQGGGHAAAPTHPPSDRRNRPREVLLGAACARGTAEASLWASLIAARTARAGRRHRRPPHRRRTSPRAGCP